MSDGSAQIFLPRIGGTYRIHSGEHIFLGRVIKSDNDTVTVEPTDPVEGVKTVKLKRLHARFEEWV